MVRRPSHLIDSMLHTLGKNKLNVKEAIEAGKILMTSIRVKPKNNFSLVPSSKGWMERRLFDQPSVTIRLMSLFSSK
jgi:hypothetical protein